jgi:hypothetical protein
VLFICKTCQYKLTITNSLIRGWKLFTKYVGSPLVILSISHGDGGIMNVWIEVDIWVFKELVLEEGA